MFNILAYILSISIGLLEVFRNFYGNKLIFKKKGIYFSIIFLIIGGAIIAQYLDDKAKSDQINELTSHLTMLGYKYDTLGNRYELALKKIDSFSSPQNITTGNKQVFKFLDVSGDNNSITASNLNYYSIIP